jgi:hypothetical protein
MPAEDPGEKSARIAYEAPLQQPNHERPYRREWQKPSKNGVSRKFLLRALFRKAGVEERINLQREGNNAKPYQVKAVRAVILKYKLGEVE